MRAPSVAFVTAILVSAGGPAKAAGDLEEDAAACAAAESAAARKPEELPARERYEALLRVRACRAAELSRRLSGAKDDRGPDVRLLVAAATSRDEAAEPKLANARNQAEFMGISFGVGVGFSYSFDDVVTEAEIGADGKVVATKRQRQMPRVILESHTYGLCKLAACNAGRFGIGPYFGIVARSDELLSGFSAGVMVGWRDSTTSQGLSIGLGAILDDEVRSLAEGFEVGQPPPAGETAIRYESSARWSGILFFTRTF